MGRSPKKGLPFFKKDIDYYEDLKIIDLLDKYGPLGNTIFDCILCMIYREGYYLNVSMDRLTVAVVRVVGSKWIKDKRLVPRVIDYCADIGLIDKDLLALNIVTSVGIQKRYAEVTSRNKADKSLYWLLEKVEKDKQPLENAPKEPFSVTSIPISVTEMPINEEDISTKKEERRKKKVESRLNITPPTLKQVEKYCQNKNVNAYKFYSHYNSLGWVTATRQKIISWKSLVDKWEATENENTTTKTPSTFDMADFDSMNVFDLKY